MSAKAREKVIRQIMDAALMHQEPISRHGTLIAPRMKFEAFAAPLLDIALLLPREYWVSDCAAIFY